MNRMHLCAILCVLCLLALRPLPAAAGDIDFSGLTIMTEHYPPYNFMRNGLVVGFSTDIVMDILNRLQAPVKREDILLLPWAQGYRRILTSPRNVLYSMTRTQEREKLFQWAGPLVTNKVGLLAKKSANVKIRTFHDLRSYRVGVVRDDVGQQLLVNRGYPEDELDIANDSASNIRKLEKNRIDLFCYDLFVANYLLRMSDLDVDAYEPVYTLTEGSVYIAFHKDENPALVAAFQEQLDAIKTPLEEGGDSVYDRIMAKYF